MSEISLDYGVKCLVLSHINIKNDTNLKSFIELLKNRYTANTPMQHWLILELTFFTISKDTYISE